MKKLLFAMLFTSLLIAGTVYGEYQIVDIFICDSGMVMAEISAKSIVSRKELYRASYCTCEGVDSSLKNLVQKGTWKNQGYEFQYGMCEAPRNRVFRCVCVGQNTY